MLAKGMKIKRQRYFPDKCCQPHLRRVATSSARRWIVTTYWSTIVTSHRVIQHVCVRTRALARETPSVVEIPRSSVFSQFDVVSHWRTIISQATVTANVCSRQKQFNGQSC